VSVGNLDEAERALVTRPDQRLPAEPGGDVPAVTEHPGEQVVGDHDPVAVPATCVLPRRSPSGAPLPRVETSVHGVGRPDEQVGPLELARGPLGQRAQPEPDRDGRGREMIWYTSGWPSSASDSGVPQRGQYGLIRWSRTSSPASKTTLSDHQTDSM